MFKKNLLEIVDDLQNYKRDKKTLLSSYINIRLNDSLKMYYKEMTDSFNYLKYRNEVTVSKNINKES